MPESSRIASDEVEPAKPETLDIADQIARRRIEAESYRKESKLLDEQLMRSVAAKNAQHRESKPGIEHARAYHQARKDRLEREIMQLGEPKEQSPQWYYKQYLQQELASKDDSPL